MSEPADCDTEVQHDENTTGLVRLHTNIGREGVIAELRREGWDFPNERDMKHLSREKARELRDQLDEYLSDKYCYGCSSEEELEPSIVDGMKKNLCPSCDPGRNNIGVQQ